MAAFDGDAVGLLVAAGRPRARLSNDKWIHKAARHPRERASPRERPLFGMHGVDTNDRFPKPDRRVWVASRQSSFWEADAQSENAES